MLYRNYKMPGPTRPLVRVARLFRHFALVLPVLALNSIESGPMCVHDGPDPIAHWIFDSRHLDEDRLVAQVGPAARLAGNPRIVDDELGQSLAFGRRNRCVVAEDSREIQDILPRQALTVSAWVAIDRPETWGGIISALQDNGDVEYGWILGYNHSTFYFGISTTGADDGNGSMTYLTGKTAWQPGKLFHVVAVFDGTTTELYVNGQLDASTDQQHGEILYPETSPVVIGAYQDANENHRLAGRIRELKLFDEAARGKWVSEEFDHNRRLVELEAQLNATTDSFVIAPYLQYGTQTGMTIMWRTGAAADSTVWYGETVECQQNIHDSNAKQIHELRIEDLQPETQYFYCVESVAENGEVAESDVYPFTTAVRRQTPFAFAVISDTQGNPEVSGEIAELAWGQRPSFLLHPGDLVSTGTQDSHWTQHFFPGMRPLIQHVPFYPVLGNHEVNARNYFDYMSLPDPEYYYKFSFGNSDFFMIDTNRNVDSDSEQFQWLDTALGASVATWKIVCHHHPPFSSDENDYGDLWKTNASTRGDLKARQLVPLYEKHHVDLVWNGHIHSYERTWPVRDGQAVNQEGVVYMITGGGGGSLETPGPGRPYFQNNVRRGHHYCMVAVNGQILEIKAFDLEGQLFDHLVIEKRTAGR